MLLDGRGTAAVTDEERIFTVVMSMLGACMVYGSARRPSKRPPARLTHTLVAAAPPCLVAWQC